MGIRLSTVYLKTHYIQIFTSSGTLKNKHTIISVSVMHHLRLFPHFETKVEDFFERFPHIIEKIFETLDDKSLTTCREVSTTWQKFIDERNLSWIRIVKIPKTLKHGNTYLHIAAETGQTELLEMILDENEDEEDKCPKNQRGLTPFHT